MTAPMDCQLIGRWRIVEADPWDRDYLDLVAPACISFGKDAAASSPSAPSMATGTSDTPLAGC